MGRENTEKKEGPGDPDEGKEEKKRLLQGRLVRGPDGAKINEEAETQACKKTNQFNHGAIISFLRRRCQRPVLPAGLSGFFI